jgi:CRP-like cAMP-binding protein
VDVVMSPTAPRTSPVRLLRPRAAFDELADLAGLDDELRRQCPAILIPAGDQRSAQSVRPARALLVEAGVALLRVQGGPGFRSLIIGRHCAGALMPPPRPEEVLQALTDTWMTAIPATVWGRLLAVPESAERVVAGLEEVLRRQGDAARSLAGVRHVDRVRSQLLELAREHGRVCRDGIRLDLPLTHDLIADMVGCARETVTRALEELDRSGFVTRRGRYYQLLVAPEAISA